MSENLQYYHFQDEMSFYDQEDGNENNLPGFGSLMDPRQGKAI